MIEIEKTLVSDDIAELCFACDLHQCKGQCCVDGDAGAPLTEEEISILEDEINDIKPYMTKKGVKVIEKCGVFDYDAEGDYVTPLINDAECAYVYFENDIAFCAIEKAWQEQKINLQKPISCHLYPIRIKKFADFDGVNYEQWSICETALKNGKKNGIKLYRFLKDPLIRSYGEKWYNELVNKIENPNPSI